MPTSDQYKYYPALSGLNKIFIIVAFILLLYNNSNGQTLITKNKELNMYPQTENAELLKKRLEESLAEDLKEINEMKDRMDKILASDLKEAYLIRDSLIKGIEPASFRRNNRKVFSLQKDGKNITIKLDENKRIKYEETNNCQDSLKDFALIGLNPDGEIGGYTRQKQNKITVISINHGSDTRFVKTDKDSSIERRSLFYSNGKLKFTQVSKFDMKDVEHRFESMNIGSWYLYNEDGVLIETSSFDYDDALFEFTKEDAIAYIKKEYLDKNDKAHFISVGISPRYTVNGEIKQEIRWGIQIYDGMVTKIIQLDGKTGEKVSDYTMRIVK